MKTKIRLTALTLLVALFVAACGGGAPTEPPPAPTDTAAPPTETPVPPTDTPVPTDTPLPTDTPAPTDTPTPAPTEFAGGGFIVFSSDRAGDGAANLWAIQPDGSNPVQLTTDFSQALFADISPDGNRIAFSSMDTGMWSIYIIDADGSNLEQFTDFSSAVSDWSPDGTRMIFNSDHDNEPADTPDIWGLNLDGSGLVELLDMPETIDGDPRWSPDGSKILFDSNRDGNLNVYVMDADGANVTRLTDDASTDAAGRWSPDGSQILFLSERTGNRDLFVMDADGSNVAQLTEHAGFDSGGNWSPDGRHIVFTSDRGGNFDLWILDVASGEFTQLTDDVFFDFFPDW